MDTFSPNFCDNYLDNWEINSLIYRFNRHNQTLSLVPEILKIELNIEFSILNKPVEKKLSRFLEVKINTVEEYTCIIFEFIKVRPIERGMNFAGRIRHRK